MLTPSRRTISAFLPFADPLLDCGIQRGLTRLGVVVERCWGFPDKRFALPVEQVARAGVRELEMVVHDDQRRQRRILERFQDEILGLVLSRDRGVARGDIADGHDNGRGTSPFDNKCQRLDIDLPAVRTKGAKGDLSRDGFALETPFRLRNSLRPITLDEQQVRVDAQHAVGGISIDPFQGSIGIDDLRITVNQDAIHRLVHDCPECCIVRYVVFRCDRHRTLPRFAVASPCHTFR